MTSSRRRRPEVVSWAQETETFTFTRNENSTKQFCDWLNKKNGRSTPTCGQHFGQRQYSILQRKPFILFRLFKIVLIVPNTVIQIAHRERDRIVIAKYLKFSQEEVSLMFWFKLAGFCELKDDTENGTTNLDKRKVRPLFSPFQTDPKSSSNKYLNQLLHWKRVRFFARRDLPKFFNLFSMFSTKLKRRRDL